jgi:hypothetical protein
MEYIEWPSDLQGQMKHLEDGHGIGPALLGGVPPAYLSTGHDDEHDPEKVGDDLPDHTHQVDGAS